MTEGQGRNAYRGGFYKVTQLADEVSFREFPHFGQDDGFPNFMEGCQQINDAKQPKQPKEFYPYVSKDGHGVEDAGKLLARFAGPDKLLDRDKQLPRRPLVIFAFDEAHILTDNPPITNRANEVESVSELRRILRQTSDQAIFSLFLSTAGRFNLFSPEISSGPSRRIQNISLSTLGPITEISFDGLAYDAPEYKIRLEQVVEMDWMCHLGRPLYALFRITLERSLLPTLSRFASIYDVEENKYRSKIELYGPREGEFTGWSAYAWDDLLGYVASRSVHIEIQRFVLEFNMDGTAGNVARKQVERHMRLYLAATAGRDTLVTLAGSEPRTNL
jgi:hypothetical protein